MVTRNSLLLLFVLSSTITCLSQNSHFSLPTYWQVSGNNVGLNIEASDINRDGYKDIIVGNWNETDVYYGGPKMLDKTIDLRYKGRCLCVCDYNGDGYPDLVTMHFTNFDSTRYDYDGELLFFYGNGSDKIAIDTTPTYSIPLPTKEPVNDGFAFGGFKVGVKTGDFNGDHKDDVVISSYLFPSGDYRGKLYVYMGSDKPPVKASYEIQGGKNNYEFGYYFEVGDINGDNFDDLLTSSKIWSTPKNGIGSIDSLYNLVIYLGNKNFDAQSDSIEYNSIVLPQQKWCGWFVKSFSLDDINGDGIEDLVVGRGDFNNSGSAIHYGSKSGIDTSTSLLLPIYPDSSNSNDNVFGGISFNIGDFNADGYDDFVFTPAGYKKFSLILGGPNLNIKNPYGIRGLLDAKDFFPNKAISVGDQNGDGINDFAVSVKNGYVLIMLGNNLVATTVNNNQKKNDISDVALLQNYPNPFNPTTKINWRIEKANNYVKLILYDITGRKIRTLVDEYENEGNYNYILDTDKIKLSSGNYLIRLDVINTDQKVFSKTLKISFIK